jgi:hypothetical protein
VSIDPSNRWRNAEGTLYVWAAGLSIAGTPAMRFDAQPQHDASAFIRWTLNPVSDTIVGFAAVRTQRVSALLIATVYMPSMSDDGAVNAYDLSNTVDSLRDELCTINVPMQDYTSGSAVALPGAHVITSKTPPTHQRLSSVEGYDRAVVTAPVFWYAYRTA